MKHQIAVLLLMVATAAGAQEVDRRVDADPNGELEVRTFSGDLLIEGWDEREVHVSGMLGDEVERLDVETSGSRTIVRVVVRRDGRERGDYEADTSLTIRAPRTMSLYVDSVSADIVSREIDGAQQLGSVSGDVVAAASAGEIRAQSVSGDIRVTGNGAAQATRAKTVSGDVLLSDLNGELEAESVSGDVDVVQGRFQRVELKSVSGELAFAAAVAADGRLDAMATSGDIELELAGDAAGYYRLSTFSGEIDNCFGPRAADDRAGPRGPGRELRFEEGSARATIDARTHSGDVTVCRR
jgi:DUF4097 and DUF4098 domain-containing protein YvlB